MSCCSSTLSLRKRSMILFASLPRALVGIDRLPQIAGASVMEEKDALPYTPKRSRSERIRAGASLRDTVRKTCTHVVDQEIGEQVHRLIGQRGARLG